MIIKKYLTAVSDREIIKLLLKVAEKIKVEEVKEKLIKRDLQFRTKLALILFGIMVVLEILFYSLNKGFIVLVWIPFIPLIYLFKRKKFFKTAEFCYGEIIDVTLDDSDVVHRTFKIAFIDSTKKTHETYICEHWGDYDEELKDKINEWHDYFINVRIQIRI